MLRVGLKVGGIIIKLAVSMKSGLVGEEENFRLWEDLVGLLSRAEM